MTYRELQATRVLSVDAYWQELREPSRRTPREIPVPLWPGESLQQYEREFGRWLAARRLSLVSMREDPVTERNYRLQFAQTRIIVAKHSRKFGERSPNNACWLRGKQTVAERRRRSRSPSASIAPAENPRLFSNKTRRQLLERRILELDAFQKEVGQNAWAEGANTAEGAVIAAIPVPLHPGESTGLYDHRFWTWLKNYNETKESLSDNPARERRFRMAFAYLRVKRPQSSTVVGAQRAQDPRPRVESQNKIPLGVLKSARARLATNLKRSSEESELQTQVRSKESSAKRTRTEVFISVKVGTNYKNVVNKNLCFDGNLRFDNTSSAISHHAFGTSFYGSKNESSSCSQYAFGGSSQGSKSEFGVNNYGAFGKNDNYVLSSQIRSFLNRFRSRDHSCSSTTVKLSDSPIARGTKNKT
ncbi:hypothetical protein Pcac1_g209 [Phytophthora cactorum]|nr:hypothetical protein Pcac1_g209 [Phytophthora cactorum]